VATSSNFSIADRGMPPDDLVSLRAFPYAFPTESPPITGQQVTLHANSAPSAWARAELLLEPAAVTVPAPECDLVAGSGVEGEAREKSPPGGPTPTLAPGQGTASDAPPPNRVL
jgi:hypothetical protein